MKKIIHLTDLHIGHKDCDRSMHQVNQFIVQFKQPAENYIIVITGDMVESPTEDNFRYAARFTNELSENGYKVLVCPGNHDYAMMGVEIREDKKTLDSLFNRYFNNEDVVLYPKVDTIDGIEFIGLNSMEEEAHWHWESAFATGELGKKQLTSLKYILEKIDSDPIRKNNKKVIYLHHDPFDCQIAGICGLKDSDELEKLLKCYRIDALLFGHTHDIGMYHGKWNINRCYDGGSTTNKGGAKALRTVIDLTNNDPRSDYFLIPRL